MQIDRSFTVAPDPQLKAELDAWLADIHDTFTAGRIDARTAASELMRHNEVLREARIQLYGTNPFMAFCLRYFHDKMEDRKRAPGVFVPPPWYHHLITADLHAMAVADHTTYRADAMGRGQAKSTYGTEWFDIYLAAEEHRDNLVIVGAQDQRREYRIRLRNINNQLEFNHALQRDYPGLAFAYDTKGQSISRTDDEIILENGARIAAMPFMGNIRGQSYNNNRPDHITLDDPETKKMQKSPTALREGWEWFDEDLIGSLALGGSILWQGTYLSYFCLLSKLRAPVEEGGKGWPGIDVPLEDPATGECNWPAFFTDEVRAELKELHTNRGYQKEHNLKVRADEDAVYLESDFNTNSYETGAITHAGHFTIKDEKPYGDNQSRIAYLPWYSGHGQAATSEQRIAGQGTWLHEGHPLKVYQHADLAVSTKETACFTSVATLGYDTVIKRYVLLDFIKARLSQPEQLDLIERLIDFWHPDKFGLEKQALEIALKQGILARRKLPESFIQFVDRTNHDQAKLDRIASWVDPVRAGELLFNMNNQSVISLRRPGDNQPELLVQSQRALRREATEFPFGAFVDGLDATESCYTLAKGFIGTTGGDASQAASLPLSNEAHGALGSW
jgi:hypothetical protein